MIKNWRRGQARLRSRVRSGAGSIFTVQIASSRSRSICTLSPVCQYLVRQKGRIRYLLMASVFNKKFHGVRRTLISPGLIQKQWNGFDWAVTALMGKATLGETGVGARRGREAATKALLCSLRWTAAVLSNQSVLGATSTPVFTTIWQSY